MGQDDLMLIHNDKNLIVCMLSDGLTISEIAWILKKTRTTVSYIMNEFATTGSVENKVKSGRTPLATKKGYRYKNRISNQIVETL